MTNIEEASPLTKEQLRRHWLLGAKAAEKCLVPPSSTIWLGRARPDWSFSAKLATTPGPTPRHNARNSHCENASDSQPRGRMRDAIRPATTATQAPT